MKMLSRFSYKDWSFYFFLIAFPFIAYWQIGWMQHVMKWDMLDQFFPYRYFLSECIDARILPAWNPYQHLGAPFHADPQSGFWYPVAWLLALARGYDIYTMQFEFMLHLCIAGIGFFTLLKGFSLESKTALLFAIAYQCCGVFVNNAQHLTWIVAFSWLPLVVHLYFKMLETAQWKYAVAAAFFMLLLLTGGYPIFTVITNYFFGASFLLHVFSLVGQQNWQAIKKALALNVLMYAIFVVLSSGYLVSFYHVLPLISRGEGLSLEQALAGALPLKALVSALLPFAVTKNEDVFATDLSMLNIYIGILPLLCAGAGILYWRVPKIRFFGIFGLICLLAALGDATPVREFLYHYFPAMDKFRFPSIFRTFSIFSFLIVGAIAFQNALKNWDASKKYFITTAIALALVVFGIHFFVLEKAQYFVKFPSLFDIGEYLSFFERSNLQQRVAIQSLIQGGFLLLLTGVFLLVKNHVQLTTALLCITLCDLFLSTQFNLPATAVSEVKVATFQRVLNTMPQGFPVPAIQTVLETPTYDRRLFPSWHNQNIFTKQPTHQGFNSFQLWDYASFYDAPNRDSILRQSLVFMEPEDFSSRIIKFEPGITEIILFPANNSKLTLLQSNYPGWQAFIDGKPVHFETSAIPFLSVVVSPGNRFVKFIYKPAYLLPTMFIAAISFLLAGICLIFIFLKR